MLVDLVQSAVRTLYHAFGGKQIERSSDEAILRGFRFDPEQGAERTVVLVHGLGDASTTWYKLVPSLRRHARVVVVDLPPFGRSELTSGHALAPDQHADLLAPLIDEHGVGETTLVGQSMGGWISQWLLYEHPEAVARAVLVAPAGARLEGSYDAVDLLTPHDAKEAMAYLDALWYKRPFALNAIVGDLLDRMHDPEIRGFLSMTGQEHTLDDDQFAQIEVPSHIVWGKHDGLLDARTPGYLAERWGGPVDRSYLARAGHMVHLERTEALERIVRGVAGLPADGSRS